MGLRLKLGLSAAILLSIVACSTSKKIAPMELKAYEHVQLKNGLKVLLVPDPKIPYFSLSFLLGAGSAHDDKRNGAAYLVGELLNKGAGKLSASQVAHQMAFLGADFRTKVSEDYTWVRASGLSYNKDKLLALFSKIITEPALSESEFKKMKAKTLAQIQKVSDQPSQLASLAFEQELFGSHPYAGPSFGTKKSVSRLTRKDILAFYQSQYSPKQAQLAVVGQFNRAAIQEQLEQYFGQWKAKKPAKPTTKIPPVKATRPSIVLVHKKGLAQAQVRVGHLGIARQDPDFLALRMMNYAFGAGSVSRLNLKIRKEMGLTYSIRSGFDARMKQGSFTISSFTRFEKVGEMVQQILTEYKDLHAKGIDSEEVEFVRGYMKGQFVQALETSEDIAFNLQILNLYGISETYLTDYFANVDALDATKVNQAIRQHLEPKQLHIVVYGNKDKVLDQLQKIGTVTLKEPNDYL